MKIPNNFKTTIKNVFYDKEIIVYKTEDSIDNEGWARVSEPSGIEKKIKGNVTFGKNKEVQEQYGIETPIDAVITTDEEVNSGLIIEYRSVKYRIVASIKTDSHYILLAEKWSSGS